MALFYQHNINDFTKLGIWQIEEEEEFFLEHVPLRRDVTHPHKRLQHLAGRYLLPYLFPDFPLSEILIADTKKPFLENEVYHFSISHCGDYAAAIASSVNRGGIDIELVNDKIKKIEKKFLSEREVALMRNWRGNAPYSDIELLTVLWSAKESVFKWFGKGQVDFKEHIQLQDFVTETSTLSFLFSREAPVWLQVQVLVFDSLVLTWVIT